MMRLPKTIQIMGVTYRILVVPDRRIKDCWGEVDIGGATIRLARSLSSDRRLSVLLHEILHVLFEYAQPGLTSREEEKLVNRLESLAFSFLRENKFLERRKS